VKKRRNQPGRRRINKYEEKHLRLAAESVSAAVSWPRGYRKRNGVAATNAVSGGVTVSWQSNNIGVISHIGVWLA
jgi:hypothetical protein